MNVAEMKHFKVFQFKAQVGSEFQVVEICLKLRFVKFRRDTDYQRSSFILQVFLQFVILILFGGVKIDSV